MQVLGSGNLSIASATFSNCIAAGSGGALYFPGATNILIAYCRFLSCFALNGYAGAVYGNNGILIINNSVFISTRAYYGGAVSCEGCTLTQVYHSSFEAVQAGADGGAILATGQLSEILNPRQPAQHHSHNLENIPNPQRN